MILCCEIILLYFICIILKSCGSFTKSLLAQLDQLIGFRWCSRSGNFSFIPLLFMPTLHESAEKNVRQPWWGIHMLLCQEVKASNNKQRNQIVTVAFSLGSPLSSTTLWFEVFLPKLGLKCEMNVLLWHKRHSDRFGRAQTSVTAPNWVTECGEAQQLSSSPSYTLFIFIYLSGNPEASPNFKTAFSFFLWGQYGCTHTSQDLSGFGNDRKKGMIEVRPMWPSGILIAHKW